MQANLVPRRTQFSSCDACRRSRVACDAMRGRNAGATNSIPTCSRCASRNRSCTFEWLKRTSNRTSKRNTSSDTTEHLPPSPTTPSSASDHHLTYGSGVNSMAIPEKDPSDEDWYAHSIPSPPTATTAISVETSEWLQHMYEEGFEAVFGSWLGNYSCPYAYAGLGLAENEENLTLCVSITSLCSRFDRWLKDLESQGKSVAEKHQPSHFELEREHQIDTTLQRAIQTYSARWLPLTDQAPSRKPAQAPIFEKLWRELRRDIVKVINRPCYRSMITLFIFALTPIPASVPEEEEDEGIPAQFCVQAAVQQVQHLRARQRSIEFNGSKVSSVPDLSAIASSPDSITTDFMGMESIIYWAALTFDTSSSLTRNNKSLLSSGLLGWESESSWRLVKTCTDVFHEQTEDWRLHGVDITEENANRIIAAASTWKLLVWKIGAVLKEALRDGQEEEAVQRTFKRIVDAIEQFNITYRNLLTACERRLQFLSQITKLRWYELMLHYHLSILVVVDAIRIARRDDLLDQLEITRSDAEGIVMNCLMFGLNTYFSIPPLGDAARESRVAVPLVAIDPYTHHVVAAVQLLWKAMERDYDVGKISQVTLENFQSILLRTLESLPQTSKSVRDAREKAQVSSMQRHASYRT